MAWIFVFALLLYGQPLLAFFVAMLAMLFAIK